MYKRASIKVDQCTCLSNASYRRRTGCGGGRLVVLLLLARHIISSSLALWKYWTFSTSPYSDMSTSAVVTVSEPIPKDEIAAPRPAHHRNDTKSLFWNPWPSYTNVSFYSLVPCPVTETLPQRATCGRNFADYSKIVVDIFPKA
jgi:hypothetical protein